MTTLSKIEELLTTMLRQIADAAGKGDLATITIASRQATELEEMKKTLMVIEERLKSFQAPQTREVTNSRELPVEVTDGMINQNLLTLTEHVRRGRIQLGEVLAVEVVPSGERFRTELLSNGNKLQERGAIGRFYREAGVRPWDFVELNEIAPGRWTLKKAPEGKYIGRRALLDSL
jgi:hypothetical protein